MEIAASEPKRPSVDPAEKRLAWSLMISLAMVIGGMVWTWRVGQDSNGLYHRLAHTKDAVHAMRVQLAHRGIKP